MNRIVGALILGGLFVAAAVIGVDYHNDQVARLRLELGRQKARAAFVERAVAVNAASNNDRNRQERADLVKWYDAQLADLYNAFPGLHDPDGPMKEMQAQVAAGKLKAEELATKKEWYDEAKSLYDAIEHGRYEPIQTTVQEGVRIDLLGLKRATYEGRSWLRMDVATWGAPRREVATSIKQGQETRTRMELDFGFHGIDFEFVDAKDKLIGGYPAHSPTLTVDYPERWLPDFPPQVALAIWYLDPFPAETKLVDMKLSGDVRSPSNPPQAFAVNWKLPIQPDWLIRPGEKFEGEERVMAPEELERGRQARK